MEAIVSISKKGNLITNSVKIAAKFGKRHTSVLRVYKNLEISEAFNAHNFALVEYIDKKGESQPMLVMTKQGFVRLVFGFTGKKAAVFKEEYLAEFDRMEQELLALKGQQSQPLNLEAHTKREVQVANSKYINAIQFVKGGKNAAIQHNRKNCELHTGKRPTAIKNEAKANGLPSKQRTSAKEVLRHTEPETACCMSLADEFVQRGATLDEAAAVSIHAKQVFAGILKLGFTPTQLSR